MASGIVADFAAPGKASDECVAHGGQKRVCAFPCHAEYVKSRGWANVRRGRTTSGVAGEAWLRETGRLYSRCHNFFHTFSLS